MKVILLIFFISSVWANEECENTSITLHQEIADLAHSKCDTLSRLNPCSTCVPPLLSGQIQNIPLASKEDIKDAALKVAIDEYKKVVIRNIVDLAKARTLPNTSGKFEKSIRDCRAKTPRCSSEKARILFGDLNADIGNEIANIISKKPRKEKGLLVRTENACFIPEQTILQISAQTVAEALDPKLLSILEKVDYTKYSSIQDLFEENDDLYNMFGSHSSALIRYTKNNPYLSNIFASPQSLIEFAKKIPSPKMSKMIQDEIYNVDAGKKLDDEISYRCESSFKKLENFICSKDFENGEININPKENFDHLLSKDSVLDSEVPVELFIEQKRKALLFCHSHKKNALNLEDLRQDISSSLGDPQKTQGTLRTYVADSYKEEIGALTDQLCEGLQSNECTDTKNIRCHFFANYKKTLVKDSPEYKMANSSNDDVNAVLRGMISDPARLDPEVREVLVKEGILPDSKGNIAETGNIPERQPMVMGQASGTTQAKAVATSSAPSSKANASNRERPSFERPQNFALPTRAPANTTAVNLPPLPDFSGMFEKSDDMKRFEEEIQRRLMGLDEPSKPRTIEQAKKVIRDTANSMPNRPNFRPNVENKMAERLLESQRVAPASKSPQSIEQEKMAQAAQDAKWEKELQNRAVSNMAGVRAALEKNGLADPSSKGASQAGAQKKDLTKVALNIPEDPKVNLTEVFGKKYNGNDPETEVLKVLLSSKNDFLLKINSLDFKITFDENKQFKVLLQEGDKEEAFRIRPQLELFLKRLSDKNSTNKISVDISRN